MGFEALKDLAAALHISDKDIAFGGTLAIAFGARGSGNAAAHYEPLRKVINLTKMNGAGSLAHEWWHALDDYLGGIKNAGCLLSERSWKYEPMKKLVEAIKSKSETLEQAKARAAQNKERQRNSAASWVDSIMKPCVDRANNPEIAEQYAALKAEFLTGAEGSVDKLSDLRKQLTGHVIPKSDRKSLDVQAYIMRNLQDETEPVIGRVPTEYYKNSQRMGNTTEKDGGYWDSEVEMVGHAESCVGMDVDRNGVVEIVKAYPQGEERKAINAAFDNLIAELKKELVFTHTEETPSLPAPAKKPEQLYMFSEDKPSVLGKLAAAKTQQKAVPATRSKKKNEPAI